MSFRAAPVALFVVLSAVAGTLLSCSSDSTAPSTPTASATGSGSAGTIGASAQSATSALTPTAGASRTSTVSVSATAAKAAIAQIGLVSNIDLNKEPNPAQYVTSFKAADEKIGVVVQLSPSGAGGLVVCEWRLNAEHLDVTGALQTRVEPGRWVYFDLTHRAKEFEKGNYEVVIKVNGSEAERTLSFAIR